MSAPASTRHFGGNLRRRRASLGMTLGEAAARAGTAKGHLSMIERGHKTPRLDLALALAAAVGCELPDLLSPAPLAPCDHVGFVLIDAGSGTVYCNRCRAIFEERQP